MPLPQAGRLWPLALLLVLGLGFAVGTALGGRAAVFSGSGHTRIDQSTVVNRLESVAKLVTTEAMVRDVVTYQNTRLGSTKRSLVIVTGKALVGLDLKQPPEIRIQDAERHITIVLPPARLLGVDVIQLKTYDESRGFWNPFYPADRDTIFVLARRQLVMAAEDLAVLEHAQKSAEQLIGSLFAREGYSVEVRFEPAVGATRGE